MYAVTNVKKDDGRWGQIMMHQLLMQPGSNERVIFLDYNGLNCRKENLRVVSLSEACRHHRVRSDCKSGYKVLAYDPKRRRWLARIVFGNEIVELGTFRTRTQAARSYDETVRRLFGRIAPVHFPTPGYVSAKKGKPVKVPRSPRPWKDSRATREVDAAILRWRREREQEAAVA
jgi:hypothetical protein